MRDLTRTYRLPVAVWLRGLIDDALDLATVDVERAGYGALAVPGIEPSAHRPLQVWRFC